MISKACVVGMYQRKLEELACLPDVELSLVVPPYWREGNRILPLERSYTSGYQLHVLRMAFNGHFHLHFYPGLGALVHRLRPDVLHIDEEPYNLATFLAMRMAQHSDAKALFFTWQNLVRHYPLPFGYFERYALAHAACAVAGNQEAIGVLRAKGYTGTIQLIPQFGVDPELYRREGPLPRSEATRAGVGGDFVIGYVGRLVEEKGVQVLLKAVSDLEGEWSLRLVGDGPYRAELQALSTRLGLGPRVVFESRVPSSDMPWRLNELDVLVLPSVTRRNWKEQFGRVLVEAMACEVPVIGSSSGEIPNLIGEAGLVFPEGDQLALRHGLRKLMQDPSLRADLGQQGRARVLERYTQKRIAADTYAAYQQALGIA